MIREPSLEEDSSTLVEDKIERDNESIKSGESFNLLHAFSYEGQ